MTIFLFVRVSRVTALSKPDSCAAVIARQPPFSALTKPAKIQNRTEFLMPVMLRGRA